MIGKHPDSTNTQSTKKTMKPVTKRIITTNDITITSICTKIQQKPSKSMIELDKKEAMMNLGVEVPTVRLLF